MLTRILFLLAVFSIIGADAALAKQHRRHPVRAIAAPAPYTGPTLVLHPASNIACDTPYRSTRALPCDQPVWVYGSVCELDRGLGRYQTCN
jgi:hypothetical protein